MKPKQPIPRYKTGTCITCGRDNVPLTAKRCINHPYCHTKHKAGEKAAKGIEGVKTVKTAINKQSDKRKKLDAVYNVIAAQFKKDKPYCMAKLKGCTGKADHTHHLYAGASRDKFYLDTREWINCCENCHHLIHNVMGKEELFELGLKKTY